MLQNPETKKRTKKMFMRSANSVDTSVDRKQRRVPRIGWGCYIAADLNPSQSTLIMTFLSDSDVDFTSGHALRSLGGLRSEQILAFQYPSRFVLVGRGIGRKVLATSLSEKIFRKRLRGNAKRGPSCVFEGSMFLITQLALNDECSGMKLSRVGCFSNIML